MLREIEEAKDPDSVLQKLSMDELGELEAPKFDEVAVDDSTQATDGSDKPRLV